MEPGYGMVAKEFDEKMRQIVNNDYGLMFVSHAVDKTFKPEGAPEYSKIVPTLQNKAAQIIERMVDIIGYAAPITKEDGSSEVCLFLRDNGRFTAGSRFRYMTDKIPFNYESLVKALNDAIDKQEEAMSGSTTAESKVYKVEEKDFDKLKKEFGELCSKLLEIDKSNAEKITLIVEKTLGKGLKASDLKPDQVELLDLIVFDLKSML